MPDSLIAALAVTFGLAFVILFGMLVYKLTLGLFMNKAYAKVIGKDSGFKHKPLKKPNDEQDSDEPMKAIIEFEVDDGKKVKVFSTQEYDSEQYEKVFPSEDIVVFYNKRRPDKNYIVKNELNRRLLHILIVVLLLTLLAVGAELTLFVYLGMF